jgi:hypothetical protein
MADSLITITKRHLLLSLKMLKNILEKCPDDLWINIDENQSIWKRLLHVLESIDYWPDDFDDYKFTGFFASFSAEMDGVNPHPLTKTEISNYFKTIDMKIDKYFRRLSSLTMTDKSAKHPKITHLDIILSQIRHIQVNIGYCNEKFSNRGIDNVEWIGYNEEN